MATFLPDLFHRIDQKVSGAMNEVITLKINIILKRINILLILYLLIISLGHAFGRMRFYQPLFILFVGFFIFMLVNIVKKMSIKNALILLLSFGAAIRLLYAVFVPTLPFSDFDYYHQSAVSLSENIPLLTKNFGFVSVISLGYRIFPDIITAKIINALASCLSLYLIFTLTRIVFNQSIGLIAVLLLSVSINDVNMVSVIGTETLAQLFLIASLTFGVLLVKKESGKWGVYYSLFSGIAFGFGITMRSSVISFLPLIIIILFFFKKYKLALFAFFFGGVLVSFFLVVSYYAVLARRFSIEPLKTQDSFPFLSGTNFLFDGAYNKDDFQLYHSWPSAERDDLAREVAISRVREAPIGFALLIPRKLYRLFSSNDYGNQWSLGSIDWQKYNISEKMQKYILQINSLMSQSVYILILFFALVGTMSKKLSTFAMIFLLLSIVCLTFPHLILEVQPRYHHFLVPLIIPFAAKGVNEILHLNSNLDKCQ